MKQMKHSFNCLCMTFLSIPKSNASALYNIYLSTLVHAKHDANANMCRWCRAWKYWHWVCGTCVFIPNVRPLHRTSSKQQRKQQRPNTEKEMSVGAVQVFKQFTRVSCAFACSVMLVHTIHGDSLAAIERIVLSYPEPAGQRQRNPSASISNEYLIRMLSAFSECS